MQESVEVADGQDPASAHWLTSRRTVTTCACWQGGGEDMKERLRGLEWAGGPSQLFSCRGEIHRLGGSPLYGYNPSIYTYKKPILWVEVPTRDVEEDAAVLVDLVLLASSL